MELTFLVKAYISYCHKSLIKLTLLGFFVLLLRLQRSGRSVQNAIGAFQK